ncbi:transient receptor potential cation channel subfamily M member-like 2 [Babylonia areolata]|uniref:transient receptor potential cation channel subfamily M member-like 2 n=1 Tax=Babylonia areolata TaxID=304850 RepID=UPI003FCF35F4
MSDTEQKCLRTAPSICSDQESEAAPGICSLSSVDFVQRHKQTMSEDLGFHPGQQRPPHHQQRYGHQESIGSHQDDSRPPGASSRPAPDTHQWSFDASESQSGDTSSPRKGNEDIPTFSVGAVTRNSRSETDSLYDEMQKRLMGEDPVTGDQIPLQKMKRSKLKEDRRRRDRRGREEEDTQDVTGTGSQSAEAADSFSEHLPKESRKKRGSRKQRREASSTQSTGTRTREIGFQNPAFDNTDGSALETSERQQASNPSSSSTTQRTSEREKTTNPASSKYTGGTATAVVDGQEEDNDNGFRNGGTHQSSDTFMSQRSCRSVHTATLRKQSLMSSETRRNINRNYTAMYIYNNIQQRECNMYARDKKSDKQSCQCGRDAQWHRDKGLKVDLNTEHNFWHSKDHTEVMPCDSFGEILFRGFGSQSTNSPYMRVDCVCDMDKVWTVLTDCWQLPVPKLIISVTGGAKRFTLRPRLKTILKQGLVNAAVSTGAWIITGGTATGVMEFVGEAVQDHIQASGEDPNECVALGIAPWGAVANNLALDGEGEHGLFPANYCMEDVDTQRRGCAPLDHNHTHFLLVDDGSEGKFGTEIKFRSKLESYISQKVETGVTETQSVNVPSVLIVVEGGINTMKTVRESITRKIPVVVIDKSGRAADFIALAFRLTKNLNDEDQTLYPSDFQEVMIKHARVLFEWKKGMAEEEIQRNISQALSFLEDCLAERKLLNIFNLDKADSVKDIDRAILYALLKANKSNANSQLALALAWNRCDIARQEIFTPENRHSWQRVDLYDAMFTALVQNRADFVQLFLDNGVDLKRFLTTRTLWNLYCNCIIDQTSAEANLLRYLISYLKQTWAAFLLCRGTPNFENFPDLLPFINKVIVHLLQDQSFRFYTDDKHVVEDESPSMQWKGDVTAIQPMKIRMHSHMSTKKRGQISRRRTKQKIEDVVEFVHPERELFIWAVLFNRRQLTHLFWRTGKDHLGGALFASALLYRLSQVADDEEEAELSRDMSLHSDDCERLAVSVLSECYSRDKQLSHKLLIRDLNHWGRVTLFKMAESYELMEFAEHTACQTKLSTIWKGRMALYTSEMKIFLCTFLPILVPFIKFTVDPKDKDNDEDDFISDLDILEDSGSRPVTPAFPKNQVAPNALPDADGDGLGFVRSRTRRPNKNEASKLKKVNLFDFTTGNISILWAIYYFYQAPVTKFFGNIVSYSVFVGLFSYVVLVKLAPAGEDDNPSIVEYLVWGWLCTMIMEEFRQVFIRDQHSLKYKVRSWLSNVWNRFDAMMYLLFILSIVLRYQLPASNFVGARVTYSITLAMFVLRYMQYFYVEKNMGPKVIMIRRMLTDLMFFFLILLVFVVSFGVAYHANMFPQAPASWSILANVLYFPYFQMYGELFLENMKGDEVEGCTTNETLWREEPFKRCPSENAVVPILLAVYMVLTNILLVNLLIAMFSYTFQTVQDNSLRVWRFYRLSLVFEYFDRPALVPPIIIINHLFRLVRWIIYKCTGVGKRPNSFRWHLTPEEQNRLTLFEKSAMEHYLSVSKQQSKLTLDSRVKNTAKRLDTVMEELQMIKESIQQQETGRTPVTAGPQPSAIAVLDKERELMDRAPVQRPPSGKRLGTQPVPASEELDSLRRTVDMVVAQNSAMTQRLNQLTHLLEHSVADQQMLLRMYQSKDAGPLDVQDLEDRMEAASDV